MTNILTGGAGNDTLDGGLGNDTIVGAQNDTLLDGGADSDTLQVGQNFTSTGDGQVANIENVTQTAAATLNLANRTEGFAITGSARGDNITGSTRVKLGPEFLEGGRPSTSWEQSLL